MGVGSFIEKPPSDNKNFCPNDQIWVKIDGPISVISIGAWQENDYYSTLAA
ncbi:MAG: hypothetical protein Q8J68_01035 [Methanolobus sp.]|nr:hypothetical protein [Methanolobus sp.]